MNTELVGKRLRDQGPHVFRTSDGQKFHIPRPEFDLVGRRNVANDYEEGQLEIIDPFQVVSIRSAASRQAGDKGRTR